MGGNVVPLRRVGKSPAAFRTISEVSDDLEVPQHVLRFWETKFPQIRPLKRGGGRRYYRPEDIELLRRVSGLLYKEGYTIKGVQRLLREGGLKEVVAQASVEQGNVAGGGAQLRLEALDGGSRAATTTSGGGGGPASRAELKAILDELLELREALSEVRR
ncbi:MAG TPA: MerR family transcriptional regulator [Stellaceae bacterium]|nr:MerR family transcriptional regulator [Stellaceae bacterium]